MKRRFLAAGRRNRPRQDRARVFRVAAGGCDPFGAPYAASKGPPGDSVAIHPLCANCNGFSLHAGVRGSTAGLAAAAAAAIPPAPMTILRLPPPGGPRRRAATIP
jgi:hypothetical protein